MSNFNNVNVPIPASERSLDSDPQQVDALREKLRRESQQRFNEESSEPMLPRED